MAKKNMPLTSDDPKEQRRIEATWKAINNSVITVGVHNTGGKYKNGPLVAEVAFWNHFGTKKIPARPFISQAIDVNRTRLNSMQDRLLNQVIDGKKSVNKALSQLGKTIEIMVIAQIDQSNSWAIPNADSTAKQKNLPGGALRGATPLIRSGLLKRSITSRVLKGGAALGIGVS